METTNSNTCIDAFIAQAVLLIGVEDPRQLKEQPLEECDFICRPRDRHAVRKVLNAALELQGSPWPARAKTYQITPDICRVFVDVDPKACTPEEWDQYQDAFADRVAKAFGW